MRTSYFANPKIKSDQSTISIARFTPHWWAGRRHIQLAPPADLLNRYKHGLSWENFVVEFNLLLASLNPANVWGDLGENAILLCYEKPGVNCHRRLVAAWFEAALGVSIPEI